jgi:predicted nucleic acid-binding protein
MAGKGDAHLDTSALIASLDRSVSHHRSSDGYSPARPRLVRTTLVVAEGHGWFLRRYDRTRGLQFLSLIEDLRPLKVLPVGRDEQAGGVAMLRRFSDQNLTLTDAIGLHVMKDRKIAHCWSTDFHLGLAGATLAIHE